MSESAKACQRRATACPFPHKAAVFEKCWVAMDANGAWWQYEREPRLSTDGKHWVNGGVRDGIGGRCVLLGMGAAGIPVIEYWSTADKDMESGPYDTWIKGGK